MADKPRVKAAKQRTSTAHDPGRNRRLLGIGAAAAGGLLGVVAVVALLGLGGGGGPSEDEVRSSLQAAGCTLQVAEALRGEHCDAVLDAKREGLPVKLALEVDYVGERQQRLSELLEPYPWDYLLGSVHWLAGGAVDAEPGVWAVAPVEDVWRRYVTALAELAGSGAVDVLAHPDLAKIFGKRPGPEVLAALHVEAADAIAASGVAVEISTAGFRKPVRELYPDPAFLVECVRRGVGVTLASDAHEPQLVGEDFDRALDAARRAGCSTVTVFEARQARQESLG